MKKKGLFLVFIALLLISASAQKLNPVNVATGPAGGLYLGLGGVVSDTANKIVGYNVFGITGGGSVTNVPLVSSGQAMVGISLSPFLQQAEEGTGPYAGKKMNNLRALVAFSPSDHLILVNSKLPVSNYAELVQKKPKVTFAGAAKTSPSFWIVESILNFYGSSHDGMSKWGSTIMLQSTNENRSSWKDGKADFFNTNSLHPSTAVIDATSTRKGVFWDIPEELIPVLLKQGYIQHTIPANSYPGQEKDYKTVAANTVFFCNENLPEEAAYIFTKAFVESQKALGETVSPDLKNFDMSKVTIGAGARYHDGALRYFRERGWIK
jgi:TRAP transporter TAXI family solute receptor